MAALAAACSTEPDITANLPPGTGSYRVGQPYQENGHWYYPREQPDYDEIGTASWYGPGFDGRLTADGEIYDENGLTAAHPTLPLPVKVRVTDLDNGRSLVLRVNDRGPFAQGRIIDVSARAAQLLGFYEKGTAHVRVTYLAPAGGDDTAPARTPAATAVTVVAARDRPVQVAALDPAAAGPIEEASPSPAYEDGGASGFAESHLYVQAGTFSERGNAVRLKERLAAAGGLTISSIDRGGQLLYRVRVGPFDDLESANAALARLVELGGNEAEIVAER